MSSQSSASSELSDTMYDALLSVMPPDLRSNILSLPKALGQSILLGAMPSELRSTLGLPAKDEPVESIRVNLSKTDSTYIVEAEAVGLSREDITVKIRSNKALTISYNRAASASVSGIPEIPFGSFSRTIKLPSDASGKNVQSTLQNGLLRLVFNRVDEAFDIPIA